MATELWGTDIPMQTSANVTPLLYDFSGNVSGGGIVQYSVVVQDLSTGLPNDITLPAGAAAKAAGVLMNGPLGPRQAADVRVDGDAKCIAASAIALGDTLMIADNTGRVATATPAAANYLVGRAMDAASGAGVVIRVHMNLTDGKVSPT